METIGTSMIGSFFIIGFLTALLNKIGIIPIVRFKSIFKAFVVLTIILFILLKITS